jgi:hypothetical protein
MWLISLVLDIVSAICDINVAMVTKIRPGALCSYDAERPRAQPFVFVRRHPGIRLGLCSCDDFNVSSPLHVFILVGLVIFFFTIYKIMATVVSVAVGLFGVVYLTAAKIDADRPCLYRPILPLPY